MHYDMLVNHPTPNAVAYKQGWGLPVEEKNEKLLTRLCDYFINRLTKEKIGQTGQIWNTNIALQKDIIDELQNRNIDSLHDKLRFLFSSQLTHGTCQGTSTYEHFKNSKEVCDRNAAVIFDKLISTLESCEVIPMFSPEQYYFNTIYNKYLSADPDILLDMLARKYNFDISAPKFSGNLFGLQTKYGLYCERDFMSLGLALMIREKFSDDNIKICEIGGGVGHLAYYLNKLGFKDISIVDLPTISVSQMYFLGTNMEDEVKFLAPYEFTESYDLVVNVDSLPEMSYNESIEYLNHINRNVKHFIHANHETDLKIKPHCTMKRTMRQSFWFRRGYVIEEYTNE